MKKSLILLFSILFLNVHFVQSQKPKKDSKQPLDTIKVDGLNGEVLVQH